MTSRILFFIKLFLFRSEQNRIAIYSGYLTYSTLLSLVPLIMVAFSIFTLLPIFDQATTQLKELAYDNFAPNASHMVQEYLDLFVENSKKMGIISILGLVVVAVMLISSIDNALNEIWHNTKKRSVVLSFVIYLAVLIFGPMFAGASIAISSYIFSLEMFETDGIFSFSHHLLKLMPFFLIWLLFSFVYLIVPNTTVKFKHAAIGALMAAFFFTLGKQLFVWYITTFPSYQAIYGVLATIPIMIVWIHLSWKVVLSGGQIASVLKDMEMIKQGTLENPLAKETK
ncbi:virulence factor BrkB family protein [Ursidibacter maritimus]|uniref:virulence factor BrkB family protein n=1 Tax=Ursidibacter maritimus TaxID=1331689 RepID=UPI001C46765D|nr:virulence factor BrkB family protein [Ursidibacter maritimus]MBV6540570.1 virulence factor BrkB family protein [Ursidibacter maritimus]